MNAVSQLDNSFIPRDVMDMLVGMEKSNTYVVI